MLQEMEMFLSPYKQHREKMGLVPYAIMQPGPEAIKLFSCSTHLSLKFILLININMATIIGIITFISRINNWLW